MQETTQSHQLRMLAKRISDAYMPHTQPAAVMLFGSAAEGVSDGYSDVDMGMYYQELPGDDEIAKARSSLGVEAVTFLAPRSEYGLVETYDLGGVECQLIQSTVSAWERDMDIVLIEHDVESPLQKAIEGLLNAIPISGEELIRSWQRRAAAYPRELGLAMVRENVSIRPIWYVAARLAGRDAGVFLHQMRIDAIQNILGVLAGLNHVYYSNFQFKRLEGFASKLTVVPERFAVRVNEALQVDPLPASDILEELAGEVLELVRIHEPEVDLSGIRYPPGARQSPAELAAPR